MGEMVEIAARAILRRKKDLTHAAATEALADARAVIQALSEADPTPEMLSAGEEFCVRNGMAGCWRNMLKAALKSA